ncbi:uncharacterized protein LOC132724042 [Ruditapes philippinarum]|uniref:uncharacterized protein LOC132724042 n=1 Tax=Ruditapes philippinarum TaxID=129788 RepID=UPI00295C2D06|nr:uncharacterized protein LOC132724042 [Ruditapes philippinarum]
MDKLKNISNKEELQTKFLKIFESTKVAYRDSSFTYRQNEYEEKLEAEMKVYLDTMKNEITKTCMEIGTKKLSEMYVEMFNKSGSRYLVGATAYSNYEADMEKLKKDFFEANKLYDQDVLFQCFDAFTKSKSDVKMVTYCIATEHKYKEQYDQMHNEINRRMGGQLEYFFLEEQRRRNQYLERELAELQLNSVELFKSAKRESLCSIM